MNILVTGAAGFIGYHLCKKLIGKDFKVVGIDNINNYYDPKLKYDRVAELNNHKKKYNLNFHFEKVDIQNKRSLENIFKSYEPDFVVNLAAQAGVRFSIKNPHAYIDSNISGFLNILELSKEFKIKHLLYASSSSVYGGNKEMPFSEDHGVDHPISIYAVTKKTNELMAHSFSHLYKLPTTGLRFFTVYGPWGRPDMALFLFTKAIIEDRPIEVFNKGKMIRDFTYVDDVVEGIVKLINEKPKYDQNNKAKTYGPSTSWAPYRVLNIGNSNPTKLEEYISAIEKFVGKKAKKIMMPIQPGDVEYTFADTSKLEKCVNYKPNTSIEEGISKFVDWYKSYYEIN